MVAKMLEQPTLVLNRNWQPVNVATVSRAGAVGARFDSSRSKSEAADVARHRKAPVL
jgi:hypothetical protein